MVALLVLGTIIACLLVDGIIITRRESKLVNTPTTSSAIIFAQDGGEDIKKEK